MATTLINTQTVFTTFVVINQTVAVTPVTRVSGGTLPVTYSIDPSLPTGLSFNTTSGTIVGAATTVTDFINYNITITDSGIGVDEQIRIYSFSMASVNEIMLSTTTVVSTVTSTIPISPIIPKTATGGYGTISWAISPDLPRGLQFNTNNGIVSNTARTFTTITNYIITAYDQTLSNIGLSLQSTGTFNLTVLPFKGLAVPRPWETTGNLGTLVPGEISELYVKGYFSTSTVYPNYSLISGSLPQGLTLNRDGTISGRVDVDTAFTTTSTTFNFEIEVIDTNDNTLLKENFSITVNQTDNLQYTEIFTTPFLKQNKRTEFLEFVRNEEIFIPNLIYRPLDELFGKREELRLVIDFGVKRETLSDYANIISTNFDKRRFLLGQIKTGVSRNVDGTVKHELIYIDVIDKNVNSNKISIPREITFNQNIYYPTSIPNMRETLASETTLTTVRNPKFTNFIQNGDLITPGYFAFVPLCYTLPGRSATIVRKINESRFKFNVIDFEIDRIIIQNALNQSDAKYLLLHRNPRLA